MKGMLIPACPESLFGFVALIKKDSGRASLARMTMPSLTLSFLNGPITLIVEIVEARDEEIIFIN